MSEAVRTMMRMDAEAAQDAAAQVDAGFLWDFWYPAARSTEIRGQKLVTAMLLEVPLVLGRTSEGKAFAMRDSCPHRGIPLSYGRLDGKVVECCYHGWRFDACSGQCVEVPSLSSQDKLKVERIFAGQGHTSFVRTAFAHRSRDNRVDGPGARAVCPPIVVLAEAREHSRESQAV
jgi:phenylpropionate dioxygenase-like ring-hydroxylating dioxygenase large terminal subunit